MQSLLNSMSPGQRAQLEQLSRQLLDDVDLQWQLGQLSQSLSSMFGPMDEMPGREMQGEGSLGFGEALDAMAEMADLDDLEQMLEGATSPADLAEVDLDRVRQMLGDDAADSLDRLARLTQELVEAGLVDRVEGRLELTPRGLRAIGSNALKELFAGLRRDQLGQHQTHISARGTSGPSRPRRTSSAIRSSSICIGRSATRCGEPVRGRRCDSTPTTSRSSAPSR